MSDRPRLLRDVVLPIELGAGSTFPDNFRDAIELSSRLGCFVTFSANGVFMCVGPNDTAEGLHREYQRGLRFERARSTQ